MTTTPVKVLVVEDEPAYADALRIGLRREGFDVLVSVDGVSALKDFDRTNPDIVLLDLSLPGGDGVELLRFLAEQGSTSVIFIVSGFDRRVLEAAQRLGEGLGLNMGGTLTKPVFVRDLEGALAGANHLLAANGGGRHDRRVCLGA